MVEFLKVFDFGFEIIFNPSFVFFEVLLNDSILGIFWAEFLVVGLEITA